MQSSLDDVEDLMVSHWGFYNLRSLRSIRLVLGLTGLNRFDVGSRSIISPVLQRSSKLRNDNIDIAYNAQFSVSVIFPNLLGRYVDLDQFHSRVPFRLISEMKNPVKSCPKNQDNISSF